MREGHDCWYESLIYLVVGPCGWRNIGREATRYGCLGSTDWYAEPACISMHVQHVLACFHTLLLVFRPLHASCMHVVIQGPTSVASLALLPSVPSSIQSRAPKSHSVFTHAIHWLLLPLKPGLSLFPCPTQTYLMVL